MSDEPINNYGAFIWSVADLLRGVYKQSEYGRVVLPLTVLRRLDCVLGPTKSEVLSVAAKLPESLENRGPVLEHAAGQSFYNTSKHTFTTLLADPDNLAANLRNYIAGFSESTRDIIVKFNFDTQIDRLAEHNLLYLVVSKFADLDMSPETVSNLEMGYIYEELIRRFSELSNETAGEHFTPREVIRLMVNLLFVDDDDLLTKPGIVKTMLDPACGTGGMLSVSEEYLRNLNPQGRLEVYGQEVNAETYATCRADMLIKGQNASRIRFGNSFDNDQHPNRRFHYLLANPPFGVEWKMVANHVRSEHNTRGFAGRFGAGTPRINDGSFLFLQHMISKMKRPEEGGARLAIVFNGSPLFTGAAGSGESEIRRWIIENDWLEAVVALPDQLFYNTGISTYFWVVTNRKSSKRRGKIQLIDARETWTKMRKSLGNKRKQISEEQIAELTRLYGAFEESPRCKIFPNESFGYLRITVERPLRLRWEITDDTLTTVANDKKVTKLPALMQELLLDKLRANQGATYHTENTIKTVVRDALATTIGKKPTPLVNAVANALSVRDPDAPAITTKDQPKPDPTLRDYENVPQPAKRVTHETDTTRRLTTPPIPKHHPQLPQRRNPPLRPRRLARPQQNQNRLRNPPHPPLLHPHPTTTTPPNRQRNQNPRSRDTSPPRRGNRVKRKARLKRHARIIAGQSPPSSQVGDHDEHVLPFLQGNAEFTTTSPVPVNACDTAPKTASAGDILLSVRAPVGALNIADRSYGIGRGLCAIRSTRADQRFLWWALQDSVADLQSRATGSTYEAVSVEDVANTLIPTPPLTIQRAIADYLDTETRRIDALITKKRRMIELLKERRQAAITAAVLGHRELSRAGRTRDRRSRSAIPLKRFATITAGQSPPSSEVGSQDEYELPFLQGNAEFKSVEPVATKTCDTAPKRARRWDILLSVRAPVGALNMADQAYGIGRGLCAIRAKEPYRRYLWWALHHMVIHLQSRATGSTYDAVSVEDVSNTVIPTHPVAEQRAIADYLDSETGRIDTLVSKKRHMLELLAERRQSLITSVVTGELAVSGVVA